LLNVEMDFALMSTWLSIFSMDFVWERISAWISICIRWIWCIYSRFHGFQNFGGHSR